MNQKELSALRYFIEAYFNISMDYADLPSLAKKYKNNEQQVYVDQLVDDLRYIIQLNDWEYVKQFVIEYGMRHLSHERLKGMVDILMKELVE